MDLFEYISYVSFFFKEVNSIKSVSNLHKLNSWCKIKPNLYFFLESIYER